MSLERHEARGQKRNIRDRDGPPTIDFTVRNIAFYHASTSPRVGLSYSLE